MHALPNAFGTKGDVQLEQKLGVRQLVHEFILHVILAVYKAKSKVTNWHYPSTKAKPL